MLRPHPIKIAAKTATLDPATSPAKAATRSAPQREAMPAPESRKNPALLRSTPVVPRKNAAKTATPATKSATSPATSRGNFPLSTAAEIVSYTEIVANMATLEPATSPATVSATTLAAQPLLSKRRGQGVRSEPSATPSPSSQAPTVETKIAAKTAKTAKPPSSGRSTKTPAEPKTLRAATPARKSARKSAICSATFPLPTPPHFSPRRWEPGSGRTLRHAVPSGAVATAGSPRAVFNGRPNCLPGTGPPALRIA